MAHTDPRVIVLTADYPPANWSGIGAAVEYQANALAELGADVRVLVGGESTPAPAWAPGRPRVHALKADRFPVDPRECDLIHLHSLALSELALELRRRYARQLIYTAHSLVWLELEPGPEAAFWSTVQERVMRASDHVVFLSQAERTAALERLPELAERCSVIPNGVPAPTHDFATPADPAARGEAPIVFAGRFARTKGLRLMAELVPGFADTPKRFVFAGGHGDVEGERVVSSLAARYPRQCQVAGWLHRDELERLFARASVVLVPSRYEPCGLVALEAMRVGAPVLAASVGGLIDVVGPDSGGRLVDSDTVGEWSAAVKTVVDHPKAQAELRRRGPGYVRRRFSSRHMAKRLMTEVYAA